MTKQERKKLRKIPVRDLRSMYESLVDELRDGSNAMTSITSRASYNIGWHDGSTSERNRPSYRDGRKAYFDYFS